MVVLWIAEVFAVGRQAGWNLVEWVAGLSTERAQEMQKSSCQWSVASGQGSGASFEFQFQFQFRVSGRTT